jgi:hypothetical protein
MLAPPCSPTWIHLLRGRLATIQIAYVAQTICLCLVKGGFPLNPVHYAHRLFGNPRLEWLCDHFDTRALPTYNRPAVNIFTPDNFTDSRFGPQPLTLRVRTAASALVDINPGHTGPNRIAWVDARETTSTTSSWDVAAGPRQTINRTCQPQI